MYERKLNHYRETGYSQEQLATIENEFEEEQIRIQRNITDKLLRNFRRIDYHFDGLGINAYPLDKDDFMHLDLNSNFQANNSDHILSQIANAVSDYEKGNKQK